MDFFMLVEKALRIEKTLFKKIVRFYCNNNVTHKNLLLRNLVVSSLRIQQLIAK